MIEQPEMATVEIDAESELAKALASAGKKQVVLISSGRRYLVSRDPAGPVDEANAVALREALRAAAGIFTPEEAETLKQDIYRWREEGTRPLTRP